MGDGARRGASGEMGGLVTREGRGGAGAGACGGGAARELDARLGLGGARSAQKVRSQENTIRSYRRNEGGFLAVFSG